MEDIKRKRGRTRNDSYSNGTPAGYIDIPLDELEAVDVSNQHLEKMARGYFVGKTAVGRRQDVRKMLEDKVVGRIGKKGKYLVDKLFELIEGVTTVSYMHKVPGQKEKEPVVYKRPPDLNAIIYALDRVLGKPKQMNVQANFSLSQLLIGENKNNGELLSVQDEVENRFLK